MQRLACFLVGTIAASIVGCTTTSTDITNVVVVQNDGGGAFDASPLEDATRPSADGDTSGDDGGVGLDAAPSVTATVSGSLFGQTLTGPTAVAFSSLGQSGFEGPTGIVGGSPAELLVLLTDAPATCAMQADGPPPGHSLITVFANDWVDSGLPVTSIPTGPVVPGSYPIDGNGGTGRVSSGAFTFEQRSASCTYTAVGVFNGETDDIGTVTIASFDGGSVQGSFTVTIGDGGTMTGTFDTTICAPGATYDAGCP